MLSVFVLFSVCLGGLDSKLLVEDGFDFIFMRPIAQGVDDSLVFERDFGVDVEHRTDTIELVSGHMFLFSVCLGGLDWPHTY